jgi:hypothetical protein
MKKLWVLVAMALLSACGSSDTVSSFTTTSSPQGTGTVTVSFDHSAAKTVGLAAPAAAFIRVVISNPTLVVNHVSYKALQDAAIPGSMTFTVPAANGYTVEAVSYVKDTTLNINRILKYAKSSLNVAVNSTNPVTLALTPITVALNLPPAGVNTGAPYTVTATIPAVSPLQPLWSLIVKTSDFSGPNHLGTTISPDPHNLTAPAAFTPGTLYAQGEFFMKDDLLDTTEVNTGWTFNYPNPAYGDAPVTTPLNVPSGNVNITITGL